MRRCVQVFALSLALIAPATSAFALEAAKVAAIAKAADRFAELAKDSHNTGKPPRQTDPAVKPLLDLVFDTTEIERGKPVPMTQLNTLNGWNMAAIKVGLIYMLAGTGTTDIAALGNDPKAGDKVNSNTAEFSPELGRYFDAQLRLQGAIIDTVHGFLPTASKAQLENPNFKTGIGQIRGGVAQTINGLVGTFAVDGVTDEWRRGRIAVVNSIAPKVAKFLLPEEARVVRETALEIARQMQDQRVKDGLAAFAKAVTPK